MSLELLEKMIEDSLTDEKLKEYVGNAIENRMSYILQDSLTYKVEKMISDTLNETIKPLIAAKMESMKPALNEIIGYELTEKFREEVKNYSVSLDSWKIRDSIRLEKNKIDD